MPKEVLARALDPFFTTKAEGKGTGLGLSMINSMLEKIGGAMKIDSESLVGSTVTLYFPRTDLELKSPNSALSQESPQTIN